MELLMLFFVVPLGIGIALALIAIPIMMTIAALPLLVGLIYGFVVYVLPVILVLIFIGFLTTLSFESIACLVLAVVICLMIFYFFFEDEINQQLKGG